MGKIRGSNKRTFLYKLGVALLITCIPFWIIPIIIPFMYLPLQIKASIITGSIVIAELIFWIGAILVGKEVINKIKNYFNPKKWGSKRGSGENGKRKYS